MEQKSQGTVKNERIVSGEAFEEDRQSDNNLRPATLSEFVGQKKIKENLSIFIEI